MLFTSSILPLAVESIFIMYEASFVILFLFGAQSALGEALHFVLAVNSQQTHILYAYRVGFWWSATRRRWPDQHFYDIACNVPQFGKHCHKWYRLHLQKTVHFNFSQVFNVMCPNLIRCRKNHMFSVHIMQIAGTHLSAITKVFGGYNRGMLSAVKSCGQS